MWLYITHIMKLTWHHNFEDLLEQPSKRVNNIIYVGLHTQIPIRGCTLLFCCSKLFVCLHFLLLICRFLKDFMEPFNKSTAMFIKKLLEKADGKTEVKMSEHFNRCTLDVISKVRFSMRFFYHNFLTQFQVSK